MVSVPGAAARLGLALALIAGCLPATAGNRKSGAIRLVVVVSIDQMRADYLTRFAQHYLPAHSEAGVGGFAWLTKSGAWYANAHIAHVPTFTGPGHATLLTGSAPSLNGIVGNSWFERADGRVRSCVADGTVRTAGGEGRAGSPRALLVTTVGDELKLATGGAAKVVAISFKDRPAILMAGHKADLALWLDDASGAWVTSTYYRPDGSLPEWVRALNAERPMDAYAGRVWGPLLEADAYRATLDPAGRALGASPPFAHPLGGQPVADQAFREALAVSGLGNELMVEVTRRAVRAESLGQDDAPDLLLLSLSTNDFVGHDHGPHSAEVLDTYVRTDRVVASVLQDLDRVVPGGLESVLVVLTADHGVADVPEQVGEAGSAVAGRARPDAVNEAVEKSLDAVHGADDWVAACTRTLPNVYLNQARIAAHALQPEQVETVAARAAMTVPGVYAALTRSQLLTGQVPPTDWARAVVLGFHPRRSGDLVLVPQPGWIAAANGTTHGSPWVYDTHVPLLLRGPGIRDGRVMRRVTTMDLAPTLSQLLGIGYPSGCLGQPLDEALGGD